MIITPEQIEKVCRFTALSPEEARAALEQSGGSPLDAVLLLERQGKSAPPSGGAWSTRYGAPPGEEKNPFAKQSQSTSPASPWRKKQRQHKFDRRSITDALKSLLRNCTNITIDVWRGDDLLVGIPLIICVLLFLVAYYVMIPLSIVGLLLRCRYHISGWDFGQETINRTMDQVADTMADWSNQVWTEMKDHRGRHGPKE